MIKEKVNMTEKDLIVEQVDQTYEGKVYHRDITIFSILGFFVGGIILALLAYLIAAGVIPVSGFGQFSASGTGPASVVGFGFGSAIGGLAGALLGLKRIS